MHRGTKGTRPRLRCPNSETFHKSSERPKSKVTCIRPLRCQWRQLKLGSMVRNCRWLWFAFLLLIGAGRILAADPAERAFQKASSTFTLNLWQQADSAFGEFIQAFPKSPRVPEAILYQAEAKYMEGNFPEAAALLTSSQKDAGQWTDAYLYWIAQAQLRIGDNAAAAETFSKLLASCPQSSKCLEASVGQAAALARSGKWKDAATLLQAGDGPFQERAKTNQTEVAAQGYLLLGEAQLREKNYEQAGAAAAALKERKLDPEMDWRREFLYCRLLAAQGKLEAAEQSSTNLFALAGAAAAAQSDTKLASPEERLLARYNAIPAANFRAETVSLQAKLWERLQRPEKAVSSYELNLTNSPPEYQRQALLKVTELRLNQNNENGAAQARQTLQAFLNQYSNAPAADMAWLTLGELQLKQAVEVTRTGRTPTSDETNLVQQALERFDVVLNTYSNSSLRGKAFLDKGWCFWKENRWQEGQDAFQQATKELPISEDQAVARFKWADCQFNRGDYAGAITNYRFVTDHYESVPEVRGRLAELALYQTVRAAISVTNLAAADAAVEKILLWYPNGFAGDHCLLMVGQAREQNRNPEEARKLFTEIEKYRPDSQLLPEVRLAVARTYEEQANWNAAITNYENWIRIYTNHTNTELPRAEFYRAWDTSMAGDETNALTLFTEFVNRFPNHPLAQQAQFWAGDYYFNQHRYQDAEGRYQLVYNNTNWPRSDLTYQAQLMAGRAAVARLSYSDAIRDYFSPLTIDTNCSPTLRAKAFFAWGDALMSRDSTNKVADFKEAISRYQQIPMTNQLAAPALGEIGNCYLQLASVDSKSSTTYYQQAAKAYQQVTNLTAVPATARSQAIVGLGMVAENLAQDAQGKKKTELQEQALNYYIEVIPSVVLAEAEKADPYWVREAGLKAVRLAEVMQRWDVETRICKRLEELLPQAKTAFEKKRLAATAKLAGK